MAELLTYQRAAIKRIAESAKETQAADLAIIHTLLTQFSAFTLSAEDWINRLFTGCAVTVNFHPDRFSNNGKMIIQNLLEEGVYKNQFSTGITNGGRTAYYGGERDLWERELFQGLYHQAEVKLIDRPKYGALNLLNYLDGAAPRFGSCFFTLKEHLLERATFAFGDSSTNPECKGTRSAFYSVFKALLLDTQKSHAMLNDRNYDLTQALIYWAEKNKNPYTVLSKELDHTIETHIHGEISLSEDIDCFFVDESFQNSIIYPDLLALSQRYGLNLHWIPRRKILLASITDEFRGPMIGKLAARILQHFPQPTPEIDAELIGRASRCSVQHPEIWAEFGNEQQLFQYLKQLWHTVAHFG